MRLLSTRHCLDSCSSSRSLPLDFTSLGAVPAFRRLKHLPRRTCALAPRQLQQVTVSNLMNQDLRNNYIVCVCNGMTTMRFSQNLTDQRWFCEATHFAEVLSKASDSLLGCFQHICTWLTSFHGKTSVVYQICIFICLCISLCIVYLFICLYLPHSTTIASFCSICIISPTFFSQNICTAYSEMASPYSLTAGVN